MLRSITFIKAVHTAIFVALTLVLGALLYEVVFDRITIASWIALALILLEGIVLLANGWRCPLTLYAEKLGSPHGQVTDIFLPAWLAQHVFQIYGALSAAAVIVLLFRLVS